MTEGAPVSFLVNSRDDLISWDLGPGRAGRRALARAGQHLSNEERRGERDE